MEAEEEGWGQLVSLTDFDSDPITISQEKFSIGRAKDCELSLSENKLVSGHHCCIQKDESGNAWLSDSSTNGTLLNLKHKITKGNRKELKHGDEFYIVYKKNDPDLNVGYMYQNLEELKNEIEATQDYSPNLNLDSTLVDDDVNVLDETSDEPGDQLKRKRTIESESKDEPAKKKVHTGDSATDRKDAKKSDKSKTEELAVDTDDKKVTESEATSSGQIEEKGDKDGKSSKTADASSSKDEIEEALICLICQEILHECVSLQPCMHSFCAGCFSEWMERSDECPTCRMKVERINKNHIVNNLIDAYLKENPDKRRPEEDLKELDSKNKISRDMLYPGKKKHASDDSDYSDSDDPDNENSDEDDPPPLVNPAPFFNPAPQGGMLFGFGTPIFGTQRPAVFKCRQCPGYVDPNASNTGITGIATAALNLVKNAVGLGDKTGSGADEATGNTSTDDAQPSTSGTDDSAKNDGVKKDDEKTMPTPPAYVCTPTQNHCLCQCCLQPMPDRRHEHQQHPNDVPPMQCSICYRSFCHAYWGCKKAECMGCIGKFKDLVFGRKCLTNLILDNTVESEIFQNYIDSKNITLNDVRDRCMENLDSGKYTCTDQYRGLTSNMPLCYPCGLRNFKELAYKYRVDIKKEDLPEDIRRRPDCYWGKNCRTQRNKPHHAKNFSHICEQTRTT